MIQTQSQLGFLTQILGTAAFNEVSLANRHRAAATIQSITLVKGEMEGKSDHRLEVIVKSNHMLSLESQHNEEARSAMSVRKRKVERARRKLEKLKIDNSIVQEQIECEA